MPDYYLQFMKSYKLLYYFILTLFTVLNVP